MPGRLIISRLPGSVSSNLFLTQDVSAPMEIVGFTKEDSTYSGPCCRLVRNDNNAQQDIGWGANGKDWDSAAASTFLSGTTGLITTMYGQRLVADFTQATKANMPTLSFDSDGFAYMGMGSGKWLESAGTAWKTAKVHCFVIAKRNYLSASLNDKPDACLFSYGSGAYASTARYAFAVDSGTYAPQFSRNGSWDQFEAQQDGHPGEAYMGKWTVHDVNCNTKEYRVDKRVMYSGIATADITYPNTQKIVLGNDSANTHAWPSKGIRAFAFYNAAQSSTVRNQIADHLTAQTGLGITTLPSTVTTSGAPGFTFTPVYVTGYGTLASADNAGIQWSNQHASLPWSVSVANNVSNSKDLVRYELHDDDGDNIITNANRCERATSDRQVTPGQTVWLYVAYYLEACPTQSSVSADWSLVHQIHYDDAGGAGAPDLFFMSLKGGIIGFVSQVGDGSHVDWTDIVHGTDTLVTGTWMAMLAKLTWSASRGSSTDKFEVWHGPHGSTLPKVVDHSSGGNYYDTGASSAYLKQGWYRGSPNSNASPVVMLVANNDLSTSANAFASYVTTQPALPTHA